MEFIAHKNQSLDSHLKETAKICRRYADKIGFGDYGELLGLLHDVGKYSEKFQNYIKSNLDMIQPEDDEYIDGIEAKGKIDHSTAGAQIIWNKTEKTKAESRILGQLLALCIASHHSGLIDCISTSNSRGTFDNFTHRMNKNDSITFYSEILKKIEIEIIEKIQCIIKNDTFTKPIKEKLKRIYSYLPELPVGGKKQNSIIFNIQTGFLVRFLFSCLIDADRQDSADSENQKNKKVRQNNGYVAWKILCNRLEEKIQIFGKTQNKIDKIRACVSKQCVQSAENPQGLFTLTVPTGGGKTLSSLRFALKHAEKYNLDRIVYIVPFTTIIDQNAGQVREILEREQADFGNIVLEHHSNLDPEKSTWKNSILCENWDAPIIFTTMVQFLESFFGAGTKTIRRMHQLAKSVIIFDEIQTLPIKCTHLFCNAINFLTQQCSSSVVLCTATQPLLGAVDELKGRLMLGTENEIIQDVPLLFSSLKRVMVSDKQKPQKWTVQETAEFAIEETQKNGSCLIIVNTKKSARELYAEIVQKTAISCIHLSTALCPKHRKDLFKIIAERLHTVEPVICVSTQLIEAGVDIDFGCVIRYTAGLDSIAQAAGRCNRHGKRETGSVFIINPAKERIENLTDIVEGKKCTDRVLYDFKENPEKYGNDPIGIDLLHFYYKCYFYERSAEMAYPVSSDETGRSSTLLNMLSHNSNAEDEYNRTHPTTYPHLLKQSFKTAAEIFKSIDAPTYSVIVQYEEGEEIIGKLCAAKELEYIVPTLKKAQQYSVNIFDTEFSKLLKCGAVNPIQDFGLFFLAKEYYSAKFGVTLEPIQNTNKASIF